MDQGGPFQPMFSPPGKNLILMCDAYKFSHYKLFPPGLTHAQFYLESRLGARWPRTIFFGLQYCIQEYLQGRVVTEEKIQEAKEFCHLLFGADEVFNKAGWKHVLEDHGGYLPVRIWAVPEGSSVPAGVPLLTVENTCPQCAWLVSYLETKIVQGCWYPCTVATQSQAIRQLVKDWVMKSAPDNLPALDWMVHDFGYRGVSSEETAALGAAAHLLSFNGTDTVAGDIMLRNHYGAKGLVSGSIPASEHSTVTSWGPDGEEQFLLNCLEKYPTGLLANVIDSYNPERYIMEYAARHRDKILARDGKMVFRPDSGNPSEMVVDVLHWLHNVFGAAKNSQGFWELNPKVGVIYGDGMDFHTINDLHSAVNSAGYAATNVAVGSGGGLLQKLDRDTQRFAFKCCWVQLVVDGKPVPRAVFKKPATDPTKDSKGGYLTTVWENGDLTTSTLDWPPKYNAGDGIDTRPDVFAMRRVFENGTQPTSDSLDQIRARVRAS